MATRLLELVKILPMLLDIKFEEYTFELYELLLQLRFIKLFDVVKLEMVAIDILVLENALFEHDSVVQNVVPTVRLDKYVFEPTSFVINALLTVILDVNCIVVAVYCAFKLENELFELVIFVNVVFIAVMLLENALLIVALLIDPK